MQKEHRESCFTFQINPICGECPQYEECMKENGSRAEKDKAEAEKILNARAWEGNAYVKVEQTRGHLEDCLVDITIKLPGVEITLRNVEVDIKRKQT
jgi:hypothetical protein